MILPSFARELRQAFRALGRAPVFTSVALLTLSLGIGLSTASFCTIDTFLLKRLPFAKSEELACIFRSSNQFTSFWHSPAAFLQLREHTRSYSALSAWNYNLLDLVLEQAPAERIQASAVSPNFLSLLNVYPGLGRDFTEQDEKSGAPGTVIVSHRFWKERLHSDPEVLNKRLRLSRQDYSIIGVLPENFDFPETWSRIEVLTCFIVHPAFQSNWTQRWVEIIVRRKPGVSMEQAQAELDLIGARLAREHPVEQGGDGFRIHDIRTAYWKITGKVLMGLMISLSCLVLVAACINLAGLQLVRCLARKRELAVRSALGANRWQTMAPLLTESMLLALGGCLGGLLVAQWANVAIGHFILFEQDRFLTIPVDLRALGVSAGFAILSGLGFGLLPAIVAERTRPIEAINEGGRAGRDTGTDSRMRRFIIVGEIAISVLIISVASVFASACASISKRNLGWDGSGTFHGTFLLPWDPYFKDEAVGRRFVEDVEHELQRLPGVSQVALSSSSPLWGGWGHTHFTVEGRAPPDRGKEPMAENLIITQDYFSLLKIPLQRGRTFDHRDQADGPKVAIINHDMATTLWPGEDPLGKRLRLAERRESVEIIGVVGNVQFGNVYERPETTFQIYTASTQFTMQAPCILLRTEGDPAGHTAIVRKLLASKDPDLSLAFVGSVHSMMRATNRFLDTIAGSLVTFSGVTLLIAAIGIYGVIANLTAMRGHSIAVRLALGASYRDIMSLILGHGLRLVMAGLLLGSLLAIGVLRILAYYLPGLQFPGGWVIGIVLLLLAGVGLVACWIPANKASHMDPAFALREV